MKTRGMLVLAAILVVAASVAAQDAVDMETCAVCHEDVAASFALGQHGRAMARVGDSVLQASCEGCHGSGAEHMDDPSTENINRIPTQEACLNCHSGYAGLIETSTPAHVRHGVACGDCHGSGHEELGTDDLMLEPSHKLCGDCHLSVAGSFNMPYAHRDGTRPFECSNCHTVHGNQRLGRLAMMGSTGVCLDCHTEKTGPFVYPHPPRQLNGCVNCHDPHGSPNPKLLTRHSVAALCIECHVNVPAFHDLSRPRYQSCQNCHTAIHGSNRDPVLFEE